MTALVLYEPPAVTPLTAKLRVFGFPYSGTVTISQHWGEDGSRTGGAVWDASLVLAHYLDRNHERWLSGSSILELGSGLGLASIVASRVGFSDVIATDGDPAVVKMARENVADNLASSSTEVALLDWADDAALLRLHPPGRALPDVVMAADVIYLGSMKSWGDLLSLLTSLCRRRRAAQDSSPRRSLARHDGTASAPGDPLILLSHTRRYAREEFHFFKAARRRRFTVVALPDSALHVHYAGNGRNVLYELRWQGDEPPEEPDAEPHEAELDRCADST
jgi:SAM-dependent methyltransferase|eukprot:jgi/Chrpa1/8506/Chrysochromulina_OHIO_Genome00004458-RA